MHEGPSRRDPRDHVICVVASPQCPPGAFTFHESIDLPELPARALYYVAQHSFVPKLPMIRFSPVVYHTLARISMLFVTVSAEHEPRAYIWIDPLPWIRYPQFRSVDSPATLAEVLALAGLEPAAPMLATVNGQFWAGESRSFSFGDVVQVRDRVIALTTLSLDSWRFSLAHSALLHRPVFGPEMRCHANDLQMLPATAYRQFTREVLYTHFRRIYTAWARELILLPGSAVMFVGPGLPPVRFSSGTHGQPSLDVAQALYNSLFGHRFGCRTVLSMDMRENDAWLFAAVPLEDPTVTWVYGISQGLSFVHTDRSGTHLQHHPIMERTVLLPSITFGSVGVAVHTFDNRVRPVLQRRTLRGPTTGRGLPAATIGVSLLQLSVRHERVLRFGPGASTQDEAPATALLPTAPPIDMFAQRQFGADGQRTDFADFAEPATVSDSLSEVGPVPCSGPQCHAIVFRAAHNSCYVSFPADAGYCDVTAALRCAQCSGTADMLVPLYPMPSAFLGLVLRCECEGLVTLVLHDLEADTFHAQPLPSDVSGAAAQNYFTAALQFQDQPLSNVTALFDGMVLTRTVPVCRRGESGVISAFPDRPGLAAQRFAVPLTDFPALTTSESLEKQPSLPRPLGSLPR